MIIPPQDVIAEQSLLAACMTGEVAPPVALGDFSTDLHRYIHRAMHTIESEGGKQDLVIIAQKVSEYSSGKYGGIEVGQTALMIASDENLDIYANRVRTVGIARRLQHLAHNFVAKTSETPCDYSKAIEQLGVGVLEVSDTSSRSREVKMPDGMKSFLTEFEARVANQGGMIGLPTGIKLIDETTCGLCSQGYYVLAARPSMGKTALALQITRTVAALGKRVLWFSMDMPTEQIHERMVASEARVDLSFLRSGKGATPQEHARVYSATSTLAGLDVVIYDGVSTEIDITRKTRKVKPDLVVIDFLTKTVPSVDHKSAVANYTHVSRSFKNLFKEMNIPGLVLCQLSRANDKDGRAPKLSDLRETGAIEEDSDFVMFLHADKGDKTQPMRSLIIDKNRQGACGFGNMAFIGRFQRFEEAGF